MGFGALWGLIAEGSGLVRGNARLRGSLLRWSLIGLVGTVAFSAGIGHLVSARVALEAAGGAVAWWLLVVAFLVGGASLLVTPDGRRIDHYGWPNGLSAVRAWACLPLLLTAGLPLGGNTSLAVWCGVGGPIAMLDFVDGWVARRFGPLTHLGEALDPAGDAVFFSMASVGGVLVGIIPAWLAALMLLRYVGPLVATPIVFLARRRPELVHTEWGRRNTFIYGAVLIICMFVRFAGGNVELPALVLGLPLLGVTTVLHFVTLGRRAYLAPVVMPTLRERLEARASAREQRGPRR